MRSHRVRILAATALAPAALAVAMVLGGCSGASGPGPGGSSSGGSGTTSPAPNSASATPSPSGSVSPSPTTTLSSSPAPPPPTSPVLDACAVTSRHRGQDLEVLPTNERLIALTFDAGGSDAGVSSILGTLAAKDTPATFFLTGAFVRAFPRAALQIAAAHPVGNHTDTHPDLTTLPDASVVDEVRRGAGAIRASTGRDPAPWFRFPYGARDARTIALVNDECYVPMRWTVDTLGWQGTSGGRSVDSVRQRVLGAARPGAIVLMHVGAHPSDGSTLDADALSGVIDGLRAQGYQFVDLPHAIG